MLAGITGPTREEVTGVWRKSDNEEFRKFCVHHSPQKQQQKREVCSIHGRKEKCIPNFSSKNEEKGHIVDIDLDVDEANTNFVFKKYGVEMLDRSFWLNMATSVGLL